MAAKSGIHEASISRWENGQPIYLSEHRLALLKTYQTYVNSDYLLEYEKLLRSPKPIRAITDIAVDLLPFPRTIPEVPEGFSSQRAVMMYLADTFPKKELMRIFNVTEDVIAFWHLRRFPHPIALQKAATLYDLWVVCQQNAKLVCELLSDASDNFSSNPITPEDLQDAETVLNTGPIGDDHALWFLYEFGFDNPESILDQYPHLAYIYLEGDDIQKQLRARYKALAKSFNRTPSELTQFIERTKQYELLELSREEKSELDLIVHDFTLSEADRKKAYQDQLNEFRKLNIINGPKLKK